MTDIVAAIRRTCLALPEVTERLSHGTPTWFVRGRTSFASVWPDGHHRDEFPHLWCAAPAGAAVELVAVDPRTFFRPPYVGHRGWIGVRLDTGIGEAELAEIVRDGYRSVAPPALRARLDQP
ncbi:phosphoribosylglycinamide formyltransferase [Micromonospora sp. WMMA1996]|uniref:MmcQ/YjbR family DNA-binding protein n=1 Tax=Micromonospora sp. WMMA1996 TaxID=2039878 RepID=UPI000BF9BCC2|nr:MmcQ/YjbR family DNA-binding protein [Micromonospora sp. WMMA1996]PGH42895.1 phosphoribosylglycinamide formyltransferase [Micromonospora sp. WMMA1996]